MGSEARRLERAAEAESVGFFAHGGDAEADVIVERDAEFFSALDDVFATDASGEGFVFHAFFYRADFEIEDAFGRTDVGAGGEKAGKLVAREQRVLQRSLARNAGIFRVGKNGADELFAVAVLAEDFGAFGGMLTVRRVIVVGPALVVEVVEEGGEAPEIFVGAVFSGVGANAGFDGEGMFLQAFALGVFAEQIPGVVSIRHLFLGNQFNSTA